MPATPPPRLPRPAHRPPAWLDAPARRGRRSPMTVGDVGLELCEPGDGPLPLLLVHDGPEMDARGDVVHYAATRQRPMRVALLNPGADRDERYSANPAYAAALVEEVLPALTRAHETVGRPVLLGQSLGALAALHAAWRSPGTFAGLMLQSGSFFTAELDPQESGLRHFDRVTLFVAAVMAAEHAASWAPFIAMTCGTLEENLANNRAIRDHLREVGAEVTWGEVPEGHTWTCWRDSLHPHLADLLAKAWAEG